MITSKRNKAQNTCMDNYGEVWSTWSAVIKKKKSKIKTSKTYIENKYICFFKHDRQTEKPCCLIDVFWGSTKTF